MKLNLHILVDALESFKPQLIANDSIDMNLINVRMLPADAGSCSKQYVYISEARSLEKYENIEELSLVILGKMDETFASSKNINVIILQEYLDIWIVYEQIQSVFDYYNQWDERLMDSILSGSSIQQQLDICALALSNPIALFDMSFIMIAMAGTFPKSYNDPIWDTVLSKGYSTIENIPYQYRNITLSCVKTRKPVLVPSLIKPAHQRIICATLLQNNIPFANFALTDISAEFTLGQLSLAYRIQQVLETSFHLPANSSNFSNNTSYLIMQLLHGDVVDAKLLSHFFHKEKWFENDSYYLLTIHSKYENVLHDTNYLVYISRIREILPLAYMVYMDNTIVAICHSKYGMNSQEKIREMIVPTLERIELSAGISMEHLGYEFLHNAMLQGNAALQFGKKRDINKNYFVFQEIYSDYLMCTLNKNQSFLRFCHPKIQSIIEKQDPWDLELLHTLWLYLQNGRSISATAAKLFIHRNTLSNRLNAIEKLLGFHFDTIDDKDLNILLISSFITENIPEK